MTENTLPDHVHWLDLDEYLFVVFQWWTFVPRMELYIIDKCNRITYAERLDA